MGLHLRFMKRLVHGVTAGQALDFGPRSLKLKYAVCFCNATNAATSPVVSPLSFAKVVIVHASIDLQKGPSPEHQNNEPWTNVQIVGGGLGWWSGIGGVGRGGVGLHMYLMHTYKDPIWKCESQPVGVDISNIVSILAKTRGTKFHRSWNN